MIRALACLIAACLIAATFAATHLPAAEIKFRKTTLDPKFRSEGVAVGDFNHDGQLDIAAGDLYYAAPDWRPTVFTEEEHAYDPLKYSRCFNMFADDVNSDGWTDILIVEYPGEATVWRENPRGSSGPWRRHEIIGVTNNESPQYRDLDGDGRREWIMGTAPTTKTANGPDKQVVIVRRPADVFGLWDVQPISEKGVEEGIKFFHGLGSGDINGDGRTDVVVPTGWWESPASAAPGPWPFHAANLGEPCADMWVYDFDGDGDADVLSSSAHKIGIWWHEQTADGWKTHEIDSSFSQTHALWLADINGDGLPDFVTGKRYWAHGPKGDVNPGDPAVMYWFELARKDGKPVWTPHQFDNDSGVGTQFEVADVNKDGLLDVVTSNKKGVYYFQQVRE
ncbi:MAG TPA: VCBS repeat-containing protein [Pirellulales bacterium]|jgi:hypothetical protein|nr:VCBS repeat-containing protein [Pirellulales bacterium]